MPQAWPSPPFVNWPPIALIAVTLAALPAALPTVRPPLVKAVRIDTGRGMAQRVGGAAIDHGAGIQRPVGGVVPRTVKVIHRIRAHGVIGRELGMGASAQEIGAPHRFSLEFLMVVVAVVAERRVGLEAAEMLVDDKVDHTGQRVGAPGGGSAAGHHLDALDDHGGDGRKIDAADRGRAAGIGVGAHDALAVEQHQRAHHAQGAQIDGVNAGVALRGVTGVRTVARRVASAADGGKLADGVADTHLGVAVEGCSTPITVTGVGAS